jgi:hypothetical protein
MNFRNSLCATDLDENGLACQEDVVDDIPYGKEAEDAGFISGCGGDGSAAR